MFIQRLKELRAKKKVSQAALADILNLSQQAVAKWETNKATPDPNTLRQLADFFDVSIDYLLGNEQKKSAEIHLESEIEHETQTNPEYIELHRLVKKMPKEEIKQILSFAKYVNNNLKGKDRKPDDDDDF